MQPYFFPYLGYFQMIGAVDRWVFLDNVQHIRRGWVGRNRVLDGNHEPTYIVVPVRKHSLRTAIEDVVIRDLPEARERILGQLNVYRGRAPYFAETFAFVESCLSREESKLARLNAHLIERCCERIGLDFDPCFASDLEREWQGEVPRERQERLFWLAERMDAKVHVYPPGARELYDKADFAERGVELHFLIPGPIEYAQGSRPFVPDLSIVDVLMWNSTEAIAAHLDAERQRFEAGA